MSKEDSQIMKGVAILLMLFLHLFNNINTDEVCHNFIFIDGLPLVYILTRAANPVSFFLILGGYGMFKVNEKGDRHRWSRIIKLFLHYWIVLTIFLTIGHFMYPTRYPGSLEAILANFTSFHTTYNGEMWFLFPYVVLSLLSPWIFKLIKPFKAWKIILVTLFIHVCTSYCISRFGTKYLFNNNLIYNPLLVFHLLFSFCIGALAAREHYFERLKRITARYRHTNILAIGGVIVFVTLNCVFKYNFFYAILIITCLFLANIKGFFKTVLVNLGNQSMNMWMIHSWFCYYLFHNFIYSFSYPLLIFAVLTIISYCCSLIVNLVARPIERRLMPLSEVNAKPIL